MKLCQEIDCRLHMQRNQYGFISLETRNVTIIRFTELKNSSFYQIDTAHKKIVRSRNNNE